MMPVPLPIGSVNVNFNIACPQCSIETDLSIEKVGACPGIILPGTYYFNNLTVICSQMIHVEKTVLPEIM